MSLYGSMKTAVSGMNAQANRLSTVGDNIANVNTTAYKRAGTTFSSFVLPSTSGSYNSGGVNTNVRYAVSEQGALVSTSSVTDLAIQGDGFFVVQDASGTPYLTRAGNFTVDDSGALVNAAGFTLLGYPASYGNAANANSLDQLQPINLNFYELSAAPTTSGSVTMNLPLDEPAVGTALAGTPPSENGAYSGYTAKFTISTVDTTGGAADDSYVDVYFTKLNDNQWEVTAFGGLGGTSGSFPYDLSDPENMATTTVTFDPTTGVITSGGSSLTLWASSEPFTIDLSDLTQSSPPPTTGSVSLKYAANLPTEAPILDAGAGELPPSSNDPTSVVQVYQKLTGYTGLGSSMTLDFYAAHTGTNEWEVTIYDSADATAGGFPYSTPALATATLSFDPVTGALIGPALISSTLDNGDIVELDMSGVISVSMYDPADAIASASLSFNLSPSASIVEPYILGTTPADNLSTSSYSYKSSLTAYDNAGSQVTLDLYYTKGADNVWEVAVFNKAEESILGGFPYASGPLATALLEFDTQSYQLIGDGGLSFSIPNGKSVTLDLSKTTQLDSDFFSKGTFNGSAPSVASGYSVSSDGMVYATYENGDMREIAQLLLASVQSPDNLTLLSGNVYAVSASSGSIVLGQAGEPGFGSVVSGALETSNVDLASELTEMIEAQRSYTANSKVFQTGADLMDVLINLKR